jgi:hypothetical protein
MKRLKDTISRILDHGDWSADAPSGGSNGEHLQTVNIVCVGESTTRMTLETNKIERENYWHSRNNTVGGQPS